MCVAGLPTLPPSKLQILNCNSAGRDRCSSCLSLKTMLTSLLSLKFLRENVDVNEERINQTLDKARRLKHSIFDEFGPLQVADVSRKRVLTYRVFGPLLKAASEVVLYFHGSPSCHLEAATLAESAEQLGIGIVAPDRPGIGGSTFHRRLSLASFAHDCAVLLDQLGVGRVVVVGTSAGGPYATAFAALYPVRCLALGLVAPLAPTDWRKKEHRRNLQAMEGFDRFQMGMARSLTCVYGTPTLWLAHRVMRYMAEKHPKTLMEYAPTGLSEPDAALLTTDARIRDSFAAVLQYAYSGSGARGMGRDIKVLGRTWGICASNVTCRTLIWHGTEDKCVPLTHSHWYTSKIKDHQLIVLEGEGHVTLPVHCAHSILEGLLAAARSDPRRGFGDTLSKVQAALAPGAHILGEAEEAALLRRVSREVERQAEVEIAEGWSEPVSGSQSGGGQGEGGLTPPESEEGSSRGGGEGSGRGQLAEGRAQRVQVVPLG